MRRPVQRRRRLCNNVTAVRLIDLSFALRDVCACAYTMCTIVMNVVVVLPCSAALRCLAGHSSHNASSSAALCSLQRSFTYPASTFDRFAARP